MAPPADRELFAGRYRLQGAWTPAGAGVERVRAEDSAQSLNVELWRFAAASHHGRSVAEAFADRDRARRAAGVVRLLDWGRADDAPYLVWPAPTDAVSLAEAAERLPRGAAGWRVGIEWMADVAGILTGALSAEGHGWLRPSVIWLRADGVWLSQSGWSQLVPGWRRGVQWADEAEGAFLAPELLDPSAHPDTRSDVYSLARWVRSWWARSAAADWSVAPPTFRGVVDQALSDRPEARPPTARVFLDQLVPYAAELPLPPSGGSRRSGGGLSGKEANVSGPAPLRAAPVWRSLIGAAVAALVMLTALAWFLVGPWTEETPAAGSASSGRSAMRVGDASARGAGGAPPAASGSPHRAADSDSHRDSAQDGAHHLAAPASDGGRLEAMARSPDTAGPAQQSKRAAPGRDADVAPAQARDLPKAKGLSRTAASPGAPQGPAPKKRSRRASSSASAAGERLRRRCPSGMVRAGGRTWVGAALDDPERNFGERSRRRITVPKFCIDRFEAPGRRKKPVSVGRSWSEARAACRDRGLRLCTEDEWEAACAGAPGRRYATGFRYASKRCGLGSGAGVRAAGGWPKCATPEGVYDLSGNVAEWTASSWGKGRVIKGGAAGGAPYDGRCAARRRKPPRRRSERLGFRCCADLAESGRPRP